jgi:RsiW-degrading membrane proteinase PrsW (M82 family)
VPRWLLLTGALLIIVICAVVMLLLLGFNIGPLGLAIGLTAAIVPVPVLVACFLWLNRFDPAPKHYLVLTFLWGAFVATLAAYGVNTFSASFLPDALVGVLVAPFIEELMKALFPLAILWFRRSRIHGFTDAIVYCGLSGVGFAMVENILYLGGHAFVAGYEQYGPASGAAQVFALFIARIFMSGFAHPLFTAMTGLGIGFAARSSQVWVRVLAPIPGLILAMMLHGAWNLMATLSADHGPYVFLYGYVAVMVPVFLTVAGIALWARAREGHLATTMLPIYARAGWLSPPEVASLATQGSRHAARTWARRVAGEAGRRAMKDFQAAATRLAQIRESFDRGLGTYSLLDEQKMLDRMTRARAVFAERDPQTPRAFWDGQVYHMVFPDGRTRQVPPPPEPVVPLPITLSPVAQHY